MFSYFHPYDTELLVPLERTEVAARLRTARSRVEGRRGSEIAVRVRSADSLDVVRRRQVASLSDVMNPNAWGRVDLVDSGSQTSVRIRVSAARASIAARLFAVLMFGPFAVTPILAPGNPVAWMLGVFGLLVVFVFARETGDDRRAWKKARDEVIGAVRDCLA